MISEFEAWWADIWDDAPFGKREAGEGWNAALDAAIHLANNVDKSTHPADLADKLEALKA